jgi:menaquinone-9 beta-reductase
LPLFPALARKFRGAVPTTKELGDATSLNRLQAVSRGRIALVGDASGTVDAITGQGLSVAFQQAIHLGEALGQGNLASYETAHRNMAKMPAMMTHLMLLMGGNDWIRRRTLRLFMRTPGILSRLMSIHAGAIPFSSVGVGEMVDLGWKLLWA